MKKILGMLILLGMAVIGLSAQEDFSSYPPDIRRIKERGYLIVAMHQTNFQPYMVEENGELTGHEVDLARRVAADLGVDLVLDREATSFDGVAQRVAEGYADVAISLLSRTLSRAQYVRFTDPYLIVRPTVVIHRIKASQVGLDLNHPVESLARAQGTTAAAPRGNAYVSYIQEIFPQTTVEEVGGWSDVFSQVLEQTVTFGLRSEVGVANFLDEFKDQQINLQMIPLTDPKYADPLAMAVNPQSTHLLHWLNIFIQKEGGAKTGQQLLEEYREYYE